MSLAAIEAAAAPHGLCIVGAFHPDPEDDAPPGCRTLVLLGPDGTRFWPVFAASGERGDGGADPLDRWSRRILGRLGAALGAEAVFPFGGPPHRPFIAWAKRGGHAFASPVGLLVHDRLGLFFSCRGALAFPALLDLPPPGRSPCILCPQPCRDACPVGALSDAAAYDVARCHGWLESPDGESCRTRGCAVRRICPVAADPQPATQSAFHMAAFRGRDRACDG